MTEVAARTIMEAAVRRELFGPPADELPRGKPLDCSTGSHRFDTREDSWGLWHDAGTGQEILTGADPLHRYGIGVLFAGATGQGTSISAGQAALPSGADAGDPLVGVTGLSETGEELTGPVVEIEVKGTTAPRGEADSDDFDLTDANSFRPSAMAISFQCNVPSVGSLAVTVTGAYYDRVSVDWPGLRRPRTWWVRRPFELAGTIPGQVLLDETNRRKNVVLTPAEDFRVAPTLQVFSRRVPGHPADSTERLITMAALNTALGSGPSAALFQMTFRAEPQGGMSITPYPDVEQHEADEEEQSMALLYRNQLTYAIGHGCAADWKTDLGGRTASAVCTEPLPAYEVVSLTPNVYLIAPDGSRQPVTVSMQELANGTDEGRCIPDEIVPSSEQKNLDQDSCKASTDSCVPSEMLNIATFKPEACSGNGFLVGAYTGVCLSKCLSFGIQGIVLSQGSCDDIHTCAPCTNPLSGQPTGAPGCP